MSIAEKIIKASENVSKVYEAGRSSMVDKSKLIPQNVSGVYISLDDVSEIPHKVECKVSGGSVAPETVQVIKFGKNLIPYPFKNFTTYSNGITATDLGDGGVLLNGTATATVFIYLHKTPIGNLYIEGSRTFDIGGTKCTITANKYSDAIRTVHHNNNHLTYIIINAGTVCDNIVFYPQIEVGAVTTEFEKGIPYEVFTPSADGIVEGMTSTSPYMNLFCNTADVTLDVEYNKSYGMYKCEQTHEAIKEEGISEGKKAEYDRFWDSFQMNGKRTDYQNGFYQTAWTDDTFNPKYDITPTGIYADNMFYGSGIEDLKGILDKNNVKLDLSKCTRLNNAFHSCTTSTMPTIDVSSCTRLQLTFYNMKNLKSLDVINLREDCVIDRAFLSTDFIENLSISGTIGTDLDIRTAFMLTHDSIVSIINALSETATGKTVTFSKTAVNKAFSIKVDDEGTYPEGSEFYILRHSKDNWTFSYV